MSEIQNRQPFGGIFREESRGVVGVWRGWPSRSRPRKGRGTAASTRMREDTCISLREETRHSKENRICLSWLPLCLPATADTDDSKPRLGRIFQKSIEKPTIFTPEMLESYEHYKKIGAWNAKSSSMHALCAVVCTILMLLLWLAHWADSALLPGMRHVPTVCLFVLLVTVAKQWAVCNWRISRANAIGIDFDRRCTCLPALLHPRHGLLTSGLRPFQHPRGRSLRVHGPISEA